jgi:hypothetical protein
MLIDGGFHPSLHRDSRMVMLTSFREPHSLLAPLLKAFAGAPFVAAVRRAAPSAAEVVDG